MKKIISFVMLIFLTISTVFAGGDDVSMSFEPIYTLQNGTLFEYVYIYSGNTNELTKLSELDWSIKNISFFGSKVNFNFKHITFSTDFSIMNNQKSGFMEDYDWLNNIDRLMCTNYSKSDNFLNSALNFNISVGAKFNPFSTIKINPFLGFSYNSYCFYSANGFYKYSDGSLPYYDPTVITYPLTEDSAISYDRQSYALLLGSKIDYSFFNIITLGLLFSTTPIISTRSVDHHFAMDKKLDKYSFFLDLMDGFFTQWQFGTYTKCKLFNHCYLSADFNYNFIIQTYGVTYAHLEPEEVFYESDLLNDSFSACGGNWWNLSVGIRFEF